MNRRDRAIEWGYDVADFIGDMALAYSPTIVFIITAMATVSIAIMGSLATNVFFGFIWGVATAICIDGLWLGVWLRVRATKITSWATGFYKVAMIGVALFMTVVAMAMSILITYQQVNRVSDELLAMRTLHIDPIVFIVARGFLITLCATLAIFFRASKQEEIATTRKTRVTRIRVVEATRSPEQVSIPTVASSHNEPLIVATTTKRAIVEEALKVAYESSQDVNLKLIERETGVSYSYIKKVNKEVYNV